jgi:alpha-galactosidase
VKRWFAAVVAYAWIIGACSEVSFVDELTIVNHTEYSASVDVTDRTRKGWLSLTSVEEQSTKTVEDVIDQGEVWIFHFDYVGRHQEEVEVSRRELERNDWTVEIPESFEERLRELGVPPPP